MGLLGSVKKAVGMGKSSSSGSQKTVRQPAKATPQQSTIFDTWFDQFFGLQPTRVFDSESYLAQHPEVRWKIQRHPKKYPSAYEYFRKKGRKQGHRPVYIKQERVPSIFEQLQQDEAARKAADEQFATEYGHAAEPYRGYLSSLAERGLQEPITVSLGDFSTPFMTGSQRYLERLGGSANESLFKNKIAEAGILNALAQKHTPNVASLEYFKDWLNPIYQAEQSRRYAIPTETTSGKMSVPGKSLLDVGSDIFNMAGTIASIAAL